MHERKAQPQPQERLWLVSEGLACLVVRLTVFVRILPDRKAACNIFPSRDNKDKD